MVGDVMKYDQICHSHVHIPELVCVSRDSAIQNDQVFLQNFQVQRKRYNLALLKDSLAVYMSTTHSNITTHQNATSILSGRISMLLSSGVVAVVLLPSFR